jgi:hypothetical protein
MYRVSVSAVYRIVADERSKRRTPQLTLPLD